MSGRAYGIDPKAARECANMGARRFLHLPNSGFRDMSQIVSAALPLSPRRRVQEHNKVGEGNDHGKESR